jgi:D-beta-D-heptose 7-phosphate kinase/D-beta-D-heptose 1-phosphate adenosyltransferase
MPTTAIASPAMFNFEQRFPSLAEQVILCIGDVMLDEFVYGEVSRISPEAPARVITVARQEVVVGGAGNVAHNIISLGARCIFLGVIGDDIAGSALKAAFEDAKPNVIPHLLVDASRPTTRKMRFVSEHHSAHLLRADWELAKPIGPKVEAQLIRRALAALPRVDAVVISDYAKGALTPRLIRAVIGRARSIPRTRISLSIAGPPSSPRRQL